MKLFPRCGTHTRVCTIERQMKMKNWQVLRQSDAFALSNSFFYFQCVYLRNCELSSLEYICSKKNPSYCVGAIQQITEHMCFSLAEESYFLPPNNIIAELFGRLVFFLQASILVSEIIIFHYFILFRLCLISINERHTKKQMFAFWMRLLLLAILLFNSFIAKFSSS